VNFACNARPTIIHEHATAKSAGDEHAAAGELVSARSNRTEPAKAC
jgi:hypothetical protein